MSTVSHTSQKKTNTSVVYLDCNATTPLDPEVRGVLFFFLDEEFGNEGSRTHGYGMRAKQAVQKARDQIAKVVSCQREEVFFTSGATESNNLAILGLEGWARKSGKRHVLSTQIEHKSVLEPLEELGRRGFEVQLLPPNGSGWVDARQIADALRPDTILVSVMHANNETGVVQPLDQIVETLSKHNAILHVDAAQTFGKILEDLQNPRIDLVSLSAHKLFAPKGVGALIARRRGYDKAPLNPLFFGGGQERGIRPGTLPVALIAAFGKAAEIALKDRLERKQRCLAFRQKLESALFPYGPDVHGDRERTLPHVINFSFSDVDSEALMLALKDEIAISNGSACTSASYTPSHVLAAMKIPPANMQGAVRLSWCHMTPDVNWGNVVEKLKMILPRKQYETST